MGTDFVDGVKARTGKALDSPYDFANYLTIGASDALISGAKSRADNRMDSPSDFANYMTLGFTGMAKGAFMPKEPLSKEHWLDSFGIATTAVGGVKEIAPKKSVSTVTGTPNKISKFTDGNTNEVIKGEEWLEIKPYPADIANKWWKNNMGYENSPYKPGTVVNEVKLSKDTKFVRVYDGDVSGQFGGWLMKAEDVAK